MKSRYGNIIVLSIMAIVIFALSDYIQWYGDSYLYRFHFGTGKPIESIGEIFTSQYAHYFSMNGRVWAHFLCQCFSAFWGQTAFAVCNALVYVLFVMVFLKLCGGTWRSMRQLLSAVLLILFFCDTSYNANCQIGYIWTSTVTIIFLIVYFRHRSQHRLLNVWKSVGLFLLGFIAGDSNEAIAIGVGMALIVDFLSHVKKYSPGQWILTIGFGIGGLILCLSPGIIDRASSEGVNFLWSSYRFLKNSRALYVLILTLTVLLISRRLNFKKYVADNSFYLVAWVTLLIFNFLIGVSSIGRQLFGLELFSAILTIRALKGYAFPKGVIAVFTAVVVAIYALKFDYLTISNTDLRNLRQQIENSPNLDIYTDFQEYTPLVRPTELINDRLIYIFCASAIIDDVRNYGEYYLKSGETSYSHQLRIYPTIVRDILMQPDRSAAVRCSDGLFLLMEDKRYPKKFLLERSIGLLGIEKSLDVFNYSLPEKGYLDIDSIRIDVQSFEVPLKSNINLKMVSR